MSGGRLWWLDPHVGMFHVEHFLKGIETCTASDDLSRTRKERLTHRPRNRSDWKLFHVEQSQS
jgi:hypothetical protein